MNNHIKVSTKSPNFTDRLFIFEITPRHLVSLMKGGIHKSVIHHFYSELAVFPELLLLGCRNE